MFYIMTSKLYKIYNIINLLTISNDLKMQNGMNFPGVDRLFDESHLSHGFEELPFFKQLTNVTAGMA